MRRIGPWLLLAAVILALGIVQRPWRTAPLVDYGAFYCGAKVAAAGEDPYRIGPLRRCESALPVWPRSAGVGYRVTLPVPLPGVGLLLYVPFAVVPFVASYDLWLAFGIATSVVLLLVLERLVALPRAFVYAAAILPIVCVPLDLGQPTAFACTVLVASAFLLRRGNAAAAGATLCLALVQPQIALPALASTFLWAPRARIAIFAGSAVVVAATVSLLGPATALEYVTNVLPMHAAVEAADHAQYSLTFALLLLHVPETTALKAGLVSYVVLSLAGIAAGGRLAVREADPAYAVLLAPAFAVFGGSCIHAQQIAAAIPVGLMLYARRRHFGAFAYAIPWLLAFPWLIAAFDATLYLPLFAIFAMALSLSSGAGRLRAILVSVSFAVLVTLAATSRVGIGQPATAPPAPLADGDWSERSWGRFLAWVEPGPLPETAIWKAPTWLGLGCIVVTVAGSSRTRRRPAPSPAEFAWTA